MRDIEISRFRKWTLKNLFISRIRMKPWKFNMLYMRNLKNSLHKRKWIIRSVIKLFQKPNLLISYCVPKLKITIKEWRGIDINDWKCNATYLGYIRIGILHGVSVVIFHQSQFFSIICWISDVNIRRESNRVKELWVNSWFLQSSNERVFIAGSGSSK